MKPFKLYLPEAVYEELYRLFPERGARQSVLRKLVVSLIERGKEDKEFYNEVLEGIRE